MSSRFYFDYNATSPLSNKVIDFLRSGEFLFGNPASLHQTGKKSKKFINETTQFLHQLFSLNSSEFNLVYHSGASEGINTIFKGMAFHAFKEKKKMAFFFSHVDHACVFNLKEDLEVFGHEVHFFGVDEVGNFDQKKLIKDMLEAKARGCELAMNYTMINNETGVVWPLENAVEIKKATGAFVHVDAVQLVGKIKNWKHLESHLDAYTFSGHKFGSLKGQGFSFIRKSVVISPLIVGGTQQQGMRAGTENAIGIYSIKLALEEFIERYKGDELEAAKKYLEKNISDFVGPKGEIVGFKNQYRNLNTLFLMLKGHKAEMLSMRFDMNGIDLSTGSACSSGVIKENRILMSMGYASEDSRSAIRFSFSPFMTMEEAHEYFEKIKKVLSEILK